MTPPRLSRDCEANAKNPDNLALKCGLRIEARPEGVGYRGGGSAWRDFALALDDLCAALLDELTAVRAEREAARALVDKWMAESRGYPGEAGAMLRDAARELKRARAAEAQREGSET